MIVHPRTKETLKELEQAEWFASVGVKDTKAAIVLGSWKEAFFTPSHSGNRPCAAPA